MHLIKERSQERMKNVGANKTDRRNSNVKSMFKSMREVQKKTEDEKEEFDEMTDSNSSVKLRASDVYSDDFSSVSEEKRSDNDHRSSSKSRSLIDPKKTQKSTVVMCG